MGRTYKTLVDGEWVKTSMLSRRFRCRGLCYTCQRAHAGPMMHNVFTKVDRCLSCFAKQRKVS